MLWEKNENEIENSGVAFMQKVSDLNLRKDINIIELVII